MSKAESLPSGRIILILCYILPHREILFSHTVNVQLAELAQTEHTRLAQKKEQNVMNIGESPLVASTSHYLP